MRDLQWSDFREWVELYYSRYDEVSRDPTLGLPLKITQPNDAEEALLFGSLIRRVAAGSIVCLVAEDGQHVIGTCSVNPKGDHREDRHVGTLGISVHPDQRGRGAGTALLTEALRRCRGRFELVQLSVIERNERAQKMYRRFGFEPYGRAPRAFFRNGEFQDEILMWRPVELPSTLSAPTPGAPGVG